MHFSTLNLDAFGLFRTSPTYPYSLGISAHGTRGTWPYSSGFPVRSPDVAYSVGIRGECNLRCRPGPTMKQVLSSLKNGEYSPRRIFLPGSCRFHPALHCYLELLSVAGLVGTNSDGITSLTISLDNNPSTLPLGALVGLGTQQLDSWGSTGTCASNRNHSSVPFNFTGRRLPRRRIAPQTFRLVSSYIGDWPEVMMYGTGGEGGAYWQRVNLCGRICAFSSPSISN